MSEQPSGGHGLPPPDNKRHANVLPFKQRGGEDEINPDKLSPAECVSYFVNKWSHPGLAERPIVDVILADTLESDGADARQELLQQAIDKSPSLDYYDEIRDADPVTLLLESLLRSTQGEGRSLELERKALLKLMNMRASQVVDEREQELDLQLARLPLGDEAHWITLAERLAKQE